MPSRIAIAGSGCIEWSVNDWLRSLTVLGIGFVGVVAFTLGLAVVTVPGPAVSWQATDATPPDVAASVDLPDAIGAVPTQVGGTLTVSGDRQDTFTLNRESTDVRPGLIDGRPGLIDGRYGLIGDDGRIFFAIDPLAVEQMNFDGLSFFPEPNECTITPGELNDAIGVATAHLECADLADVRGNGVVTVEGTIGLPGDLMGMRGDLPAAGGTIEVGDETLSFSEAHLLIDIGWQPAVVGGRAIAMQLTDEDRGMTLGFAYDVQTHRLELAHVMRGDTLTDVGEDACALATRELGRLNPGVTVVELTVRCNEVDLPELGLVPISGTVIVEQVEP